VLGEQIQKARRRANLSQEALARRAAVTREYVSQLERDVCSPTVDVLARLCAAMGTRTWRLLRRVEERRARRVNGDRADIQARDRGSALTRRRQTRLK
jgi:transcriptional regulator with XRE-family HTH domain